MTATITVTVVGTKGSVPREVGATMQVDAHGIRGTIGGGSLEWQAMAHARAMLAAGTASDRQTYALGPDMGQCCGGVVSLEFSSHAVEAVAPPGPPLFIWGAGHVGRAIAQVMAPLADRDIYIIDVAADRFAPDLPSGVNQTVAADPLALVPRVPPGADNLLVTYSHDLDLALCDALLRHGFGSCGLIGSATKWARFRKRLSAMGHSDAQINSIACPIGEPSLGKHPQAIAIGVAARLVSRSEDAAPLGQPGRVE
ncbi:MAG: xanthine dehydrogenase accessory protein XdhC [Pseudomonadota bacterium]